jgi:hypothetical protein
MKDREQRVATFNEISFVVCSQWFGRPEDKKKREVKRMAQKESQDYMPILIFEKIKKTFVINWRLRS